MHKAAQHVINKKQRNDYFIPTTIHNAQVCTCQRCMTGASRCLAIITLLDLPRISCSPRRLLAVRIVNKRWAVTGDATVDRSVEFFFLKPMAHGAKITGADLYEDVPPAAVSETVQLARKELALVSGQCATVASLIIPARTQLGWSMAAAAEFVIVMVTAPRQRLMYADDDHASWHGTTLWRISCAHAAWRLGN